MTQPLIRLIEKLNRRQVPVVRPHPGDFPLDISLGARLDNDGMRGSAEPDPVSRILTGFGGVGRLRFGGGGGVVPGGERAAVSCRAEATGELRAQMEELSGANGLIQSGVQAT